LTAPTAARSRLPALLVGVLAALVLAAGLVAASVHDEPDATRATEAAGGPPGDGPPPASAGDAPATTDPAPTCPTAVPPTAPPRPPASPEPAYIAELKAQVAEARGLEWRAPLVVEVVPEPELDRRLKAANDRDTRPERLAGDGATFQLLDLLPRGLDYQETRDELFEGLVLGFYDPLTKELVVGDPGGEPGPDHKMTVAHELNHALTDQWFDFGARVKELDDADRQEEVDAFVALLEGDAKLLESRFADEYLTEDEQALYALAQIFGEDDPATEAAKARARAAPPFMLEYLYFPYETGLELAEELADDGGLEKLDEALCRPPTSTEQVLHPDLYRDGQGWAPPEVPDVAAATGCESLRRGTLGEFKMREVLELQVGQSTAAEAAGGWHGDTFQTVRCGTALGLVDRWVADSEDDAAQLLRALTRWGSAWARSGGAASGRFSGPGGTGRVTLNGTRVDLVVADDAATADRLAAALG
jgi:hypothetical protein